jgi:DNA-directed RNA polymerase III subunit RPC2
MIGFFTCYGTSRMNSSLGWRTPFIILTCFALVFAVASALWLVPSPRWLILRGRHAEVSAAWDVLGVGHTEREKTEIELQATGVRAQSSADSPDSVRPRDASPTRNSDLTTTHSFFDVFARDVRWRTGLSVFLLGMQQFSGIDGVLYVSSFNRLSVSFAPQPIDYVKYAPLLFKQAGLASSETSFLASAVSAIVIFVVSIPALIFSDKWGRRQSTIYGGLGLSVTMFLIGGLYAGNAVHSHSGPGRWIVILSIYIFVATFCISWAVGLRIYAAECQPQRTRASATNLAHGSNWLTNFLVALTTPILLAKSSFGAYFLFGGCTLFTAVVCFVFMPETKGKSLDEIESAFQRKTKGFPGLSARVWNRSLRRFAKGPDRPRN